jgi:hypothetical protein
MNTKNAVFKARVSKELDELNLVVNRAESSWRLARQQNNDLFLDAAALNLHGFYSGIEKIFEYIAKEIDKSVPTGNAWHRELVSQMATPIEGIRPSVISQKTELLLDEFRGFRHVVRNLYTFNLSPERLEILVKHISPCFSQLRAEIMDFLGHIE